MSCYEFLSFYAEYNLSYSFANTAIGLVVFTGSCTVLVTDFLVLWLICRYVRSKPKTQLKVGIDYFMNGERCGISTNFRVIYLPIITTAATCVGLYPIWFN